MSGMFIGSYIAIVTILAFGMLFVYLDPARKMDDFKMIKRLFKYLMGVLAFGVVFGLLVH